MIQKPLENTAMNGSLPDTTTASNLILLQPQIEPEPQDFFYFPHGYLFLGHEVSST